VCPPVTGVSEGGGAEVGTGGVRAARGERSRDTSPYPAESRMLLVMETVAEVLARDLKNLPPFFSSSASERQSGLSSRDIPGEDSLCRFGVLPWAPSSLRCSGRRGLGGEGAASCVRVSASVGLRGRRACFFCLVLEGRLMACDTPLLRAPPPLRAERGDGEGEGDGLTRPLGVGLPGVRLGASAALGEGVSMEQLRMPQSIQESAILVVQALTRLLY